MYLQEEYISVQRGEGTKRMKECLNLCERFMRHGQCNDEGDWVHACHIQDHHYNHNHNHYD
jgi:hypothetical protein